MSLIVPDVTISVYSSACNYLLLGLILGPLPSLSIYFHLQCRRGCLQLQYIYIDVERKEERMRPKKGELTYNEIVKSGTIRLAPGSVADPDPLGSEPFGRIRI